MEYILICECFLLVVDSIWFFALDVSYIFIVAIISIIITILAHAALLMPGTAVIVVVINFRSKRTENKIFSTWNNQNYVCMGTEHSRWTKHESKNKQKKQEREREREKNQKWCFADVKSSQKIKCGVHNWSLCAQVHPTSFESSK